MNIETGEMPPYNPRMVLASFHRTLAIGFFLLVIVTVTALLSWAFYEIFGQHEWGLLSVVMVLAGLIWTAIALLYIQRIFEVCRNSRAIWVEGGVLFFQEYKAFNFMALQDEASLRGVDAFIIAEKSLPLDAIAGLSSIHADFPGAVERSGVYLISKAGKTHKVSTFLLRESRAVAMARLHEVLGPLSSKV